FRAGVQDDPFFFDYVGWKQLLNGGSFPRPPVAANNASFGPNRNLLAITLEVPGTSLEHAGADLIAVWARVESAGVQRDRVGRPLVNTMLVPPFPRGSNFPSAGPAPRGGFQHRPPRPPRAPLPGAAKGRPRGLSPPPPP